MPVDLLLLEVTVILAAARLLGALGVLAAVLGVAIVGKIGGGYAGSRLVGISRRGSGVLAVLVNTRGLTELVILNVGLQTHVFEPSFTRCLW